MTDAIQNLREHQQQLDADGVMVGVSRQALDEALATIDALTKERDELRDKIMQAAGWAHADCCLALEDGCDPRDLSMPDMLERMARDLELEGK